MLQFALQKKSFLAKNTPTGTTNGDNSMTDFFSNYNRIRPKNFVMDKERLFDDAIKQKITANFLKDENLKLKTKV